MKQNHVGHRNPLFLQIIPTSSHTTLKWKLIYLEASLSLKQCGSCTFWFVEDCITQSSGTKWWHCQLFLLSVIIFEEGLEIRSSQIWWRTVTTTQQSNISIWFNWGNKKKKIYSLPFSSFLLLLFLCQAHFVLRFALCLRWFWKWNPNQSSTLAFILV